MASRREAVEIDAADYDERAALDELDAGPVAGELVVEQREFTEAELDELEEGDDVHAVETRTVAAETDAGLGLSYIVRSAITGAPVVTEDDFDRAVGERDRLNAEAREQNVRHLGELMRYELVVVAYYGEPTVYGRGDRA